MKRILFLLLCFPTCLSGQFFASEIQGAYNQYVNGYKHGDWYTFEDDSIVAMKIVYNMGEIIFLENYFIPTGALVETVEYKDGVADGVSKEYWPNGQLRGTVPYKKGVVEGIVKSYSSSGELLTQLLYVNGEEDLHYPERYISEKIDFDTSYSGFNKPIWKYYAKYDTCVNTHYLWINSLVAYYKNNSLYKDEVYDYQRIRWEIRLYKNGVFDTIYSVYTKKNYNGLKSIYYYKDGEKVKSVFYDTKGRIFKNQERAQRRILGRAIYKWMKEREKKNFDESIVQ